MDEIRSLAQQERLTGETILKGDFKEVLPMRVKLIDHAFGTIFETGMLL